MTTSTGYRGVRYDGEASDRFEYYYNPQGLPGRLVDNENGITTTYLYDLADRLMSVFMDGSVDRWFTYTYNKLNLLTGFDEKVGSTTYETDYSYNSDGRITKVDFGTQEARYTYDAIGRLTTTIWRQEPPIILLTTIIWQERADRLPRWYPALSKGDYLHL